MFFLKLPV